MKHKLTIVVVALLMAFGLSPVAAHADSLTFTLTSPIQSVTEASGGTLTFEATVSAPIGNGATIYLNSDSSGVTSPLSVDDSGFLNNFPFFLNPGDSYTGNLFTITIPPGTTAGNYIGFFTIVGGADGSAIDDLGDVNFTATVDAATPEPSSLMLLGSGLTGIFCMARRKRA